MILVFCNHANNPVIYGALNKQYRKAFKDILKNLLGGRCSLDKTTDSSNNSTVLETSTAPRSRKLFKTTVNVATVAKAKGNSKAKCIDSPGNCLEVVAPK